MLPKTFILFNIILSVNAFIATSSLSLFNHWHCIDFLENIDKTKNHYYNIGDLSLITWFNNSKPYTTISTCSHLDKERVFGKSIIFQDKLWWSYEPKYKKPPSVPFYNNKKYSTSFIKIDMDASLIDCVFNTIDINYISNLHNIPFTNIKSYNYNNTNKLGLSFNTKNIKETNNFYIYEYPYTSKIIISHIRNQHIIININILPIEPNKTRWLVTLKYNFCNKYYHEKKFVEFIARYILFQHKLQMSKQAPNNFLKYMVIYQKNLENEEHFNSIKIFLQQFQYPDRISIIKLLKNK